MQRQETGVAIAGAGIAGAAIGRELARQGHAVTILDRGDGVASTLTNQKWKQGGGLYRRTDVATEGPCPDAPMLQVGERPGGGAPGRRVKCGQVGRSRVRCAAARP